MKLKYLALTIIPLGIAIITYALVFMDISMDGEFVNLRLLSDRQNLLILGALVTLVGSIFLAATTVKINSPDIPGVSLLPVRTIINNTSRYFSLSNLSLVLIPIGIWGMHEVLTSRAPTYSTSSWRVFVPLFVLIVSFILYFVPWIIRRNMLIRMLTINKIENITIGKSLFIGVCILIMVLSMITEVSPYWRW